jgi:methanogenic corrinoid protein MtbC1
LPIGSVVEALSRDFPDVTHSSLRFLEREGLIAPVRTPGGHRLFTPGDVDRVRQIKTWQAQRLSLDEIRHRLAAHEALGSPKSVTDRFLGAALAGDLATAAQAIEEADQVGMSLSRLFGEVLRPALYEVGRRWEQENLPVGQEKEVSELARELIAELTRRHAAPDPHGPVVVAACVAGERHELGLRMIAGLLRERGFRVHFLGADVDPRFLRETVQLRRPDVVLLSATAEDRLPDLAAAIAAIRLTGPSTPPILIGGGQAISDHADSIRGWGAVPATEDGVEAVLATLSTLSDTDDETVVRH